MGVETKNNYPFSVDTWTVVSKKKPFHFLTHAHKDHTGGIDSHGTYPIYCTSLTEKLVLGRYPKLQSTIFKNLEIGEPKFIADEVHAFTVTAFDANHCPGAIMLLFEGPFGNVLHTGDCRLTTECFSQLPKQYIHGNGGVLDCIYLDCTFGKETMVMPSKEEAIEQVKRCIWNHSSEARVYLACDMLGQETLLETVAESFGVKIFVDKERLPNYHADLEIIAPGFLTADRESTRFEICEGFPKLYERAMSAYTQAGILGIAQPLFIRPSAQWYTYEERLQGDGSGVISAPSASSKFGGAKRLSATKSSTQATRDEYGVWHACYSMHSSRSELERSLKLFNFVEVISTTPHAGFCDLLAPFVKDWSLEHEPERRNYSCSPSKEVKISVEKSPPKVLIPLFGSAQYTLPLSPLPVLAPSPCPFPCVVVSSPIVAPVNLPPLLSGAIPSPIPSDVPVISSHVFSQGFTSSQNSRAKRLFVEPEIRDSSSVPHGRSLSLPVVPVVSHEDTPTLDVRSKSLSRVPSRRKYRIPDPMPSLLDMKKNNERGFRTSI